MLRSPLCAVVGHVDHGKSSILDKIRGTAIVNGEAGAITQAIGASIVPLNIIEKVCGDLMKKLNLKFSIPGLLFIDTPGHAAFTSLRKRGGNLADIAVVVVDINEGFKPQTEEAIQILRSYKTPFIIAANKVDLVPGWQNKEGIILEKIQKQDPKVITYIETKMYEIVGKMHEKFQMEAERFDRVENYTKQIAIVPTSANTGEGIPELLMVISGLAQKFLEQCLECKIEGPGKGTVMEVKDEKGLGTVLDVILYDGKLKVNDTIVVGGMEEPVVAKVRALFEPNPLAEMRDKKSKFKSVKEVVAATGVRISSPNIEGVVAGMPILVTTHENLERDKELIMKEVDEVLIETDDCGISLKADSLGSLEAMVKLLKEKDVEIRKASVGNITKKDVFESECSSEKEKLNGIILGFNVTDESGIKSEDVKIITNTVIYRIIEDYEKLVEEMTRKEEEGSLDKLSKPCKFEVMRGYIFRQTHPAIFGADIIAGTTNPGAEIMNKDGKIVGRIKGLQHEKENVSIAEKNKQFAMSVDGVTIGRNVQEGDILYAFISEKDFRTFKEYKHLLDQDQKEILKEISLIMRINNPVWGV